MRTSIPGYATRRGTEAYASIAPAAALSGINVFDTGPRHESLVGISDPAHLADLRAVARQAPLAKGEYLKLYARAW